MTSKRVLILGAETDLGAEAARLLAEAGHTLALVASSTDSGAAFTVQRLARRAGAASQAIDARNDAAVRVMVRQVAKALGGLDAAVLCVDEEEVRELLERHAGREMDRQGGGVFIDATLGLNELAVLADPSRTT
jgi:NAD(P)-dependent dehydrogenase (short-subunit alcohol dehydrogenase family)